MFAPTTALLFILALHSTAAIVFIIGARRDGFDWLSSLRWGGVGLASGMLGVLTQARLDRRHWGYVQIVQDAIFNLLLELLALFGLPFFFK